MCEFPGNEMDAATAALLRSQTAVFDAILGPAINRAEAQANKIHAAFIAANDDDDEPPPRKAA